MRKHDLTERELVKVLIKMALSHLGHRTDDFAKKSLDFYKLIKTYHYMSFVVGEAYELLFYLYAGDDEDKTLGVCIYSWQEEPERDMWPLAKYKQYGFNERNAHLAFLKLIGGLQKELRNVWREEDASENNQGGEK